MKTQLKKSNYLVIFKTFVIIYLNTYYLLNSCTDLLKSVIIYKSKVTTNALNFSNPSAIKSRPHIIIHTTTRKTCCRVTSLHQESINLFHTIYQSIGKIILQKEGSPNNILRTYLPPTRSNLSVGLLIFFLQL